MGLFDFLKKEEKKEKKFEERVVVTENVNKELLKISEEFNIPVSSLDFDILKYKTYIKLEADFIEADKEGLIHLHNKDFLLNPDLEIKQVYEIKIKKYTPKDFEILGKLEVNKLFTKAVFYLNKNSILKEFNEIKFYEEMNKKKLRNNLLIGLFDDKLKEDIKKLSSLLKNGDLEKDCKITLCEGIDPIPTIQGKIIYHYKKHKETLKKQLIYPIKENKKIIEILKPKEGKIGRDCRGKIIPIEKVKTFEIPNINFDEDNIKKVEDEEKIILFAKKNGYVVIEDGKFFIRDKLEIKQINIKTGDVKKADESEVKMEVKEKNALKEAIADNMIVEVEELTVRGNVGNKAKIKSKVLKIEGQTHKNSKIIAKKAFINRHKGELKAKSVEINFLENGLIKGKSIKIKDALGGVIIGENIEIENLKSHTKIYALKEIKIKNLLGEENLLSIAPEKVLEEQNIEKTHKELKKILQNKEILKREIQKKKEILQKNKQAYEELKSIYISNKMQNIKTSPIILMKIKEYKSLNEQYEELVKKYKNLIEEEREIKETIDNFQNAIYNAKIISLSPWRAFNRIEFDLIEPPIKLKYDTKGNEGICGFKLKFFGDIYKIVKIKVENDSST